VDPKNQLQTGLAVDTLEGPRERIAGDAVLKDLPDLEQVLWNVIEGPQDYNVGQSVIVTSASAEGQVAPPQGSRSGEQGR
jgi:hypothetical protein